eukprot:6157592-Amphidinium_carterae.2
MDFDPQELWLRSNLVTASPQPHRGLKVPSNLDPSLVECADWKDHNFATPLIGDNTLRDSGAEVSLVPKAFPAVGRSSNGRSPASQHRPLHIKSGPVLEVATIPQHSVL